MEKTSFDCAAVAARRNSSEVDGGEGCPKEGGADAAGSMASDVSGSTEVSISRYGAIYLTCG
jgi:hypothetical protein